LSKINQKSKKKNGHKKIQTPKLKDKSDEDMLKIKNVFFRSLIF